MHSIPETYFLKYAFPCAFIIREKEEINENKLKELETAAINNIPLTRTELEKIFYRAFEKIERFAKETNRNKWDINLIRNYFLKQHNKEIEEGKGFYATAPPTIKELSKVYIGKVLEKNNDILTIKTEKGERKVLNHLVPEAQIGNNITIHYGYGIEIIEE
ncbi:MAG: hypothetical protein QF362_02805 [Candidatus Woesearchaeota archaeon]|jgi:hypothetical protein|nr:hypothetical protein [Candidatus Woesearchaeota archaeon]MDP7506347.1 hypothetical protein [Candidatus Woesearchaeota archaeon]|tara:strand:- start:1185 stop:1667 length:483 start_codon:yes stop_codon:yes gene_type:complete